MTIEEYRQRKAEMIEAKRIDELVEYILANPEKATTKWLNQAVVNGLYTAELVQRIVTLRGF